MPQERQPFPKEKNIATEVSLKETRAWKINYK
jgi:hypothetical protein